MGVGWRVGGLERRTEARKTKHGVTATHNLCTVAIPRRTLARGMTAEMFSSLFFFIFQISVNLKLDQAHNRQLDEQTSSTIISTQCPR